jgi:hypothetical protein
VTAPSEDAWHVNTKSSQCKRQSRHWWTAIALAILLGTCAVIFSQERTGSVSGTVIDSQTQAPISGVRIEIPGLGQSTSDESGRFRIPNISAGQHSLQAVQSGMTADPEDRSSWSVVIAPGEEIGNMRLRMSRFSVIRGRVHDEQGNPLSGVAVQALVLSYPRGRRVLAEPAIAAGILNASAYSNAEGKYQLALPTGVYYICARLQSSEVSDAGAARVVGGTSKNYFPGTSNATLAMPVAINGQEVPGIDFNLAVPSQPTHKLFVRVQGLASASQNFIPAGAEIGELRDRFSLERLPILGPVNRGINVAADGIVIVGVPDGSYDLLLEGGMEGGVRGRGMTPIDMRGEDLHDIVVSLQPTQDIAGRVAAADSSRTISISGVTVQLGTRSASVEPNGTFVVPAVLYGFYSVTVDGLPPEAYVSDIRYGGISLHETAHDVNGPELQAGLSGTSLEILVALNGGSVEGLIDERVAAAGATVVLVPDSSRRFIQSYYKAVVAKSNGGFSFRGVAPGVYQLFAWERIPDAAWLNPQFMSRWEGRGQVVSVDAGGSVNVRVRLISKNE